MGLFSRRTADRDASREELPPAPIAHLDDETFMAGTEGRWTVVDFWAGWCAPCHHFAPTFEQAARLHGGDLAFAKVDIDRAPQTAALMGVQSIPTVVVYDPEGNEATRITGVAPPPLLERLIADVKAAGA